MARIQEQAATLERIRTLAAGDLAALRALLGVALPRDETDNV